MTDEIAVKSDKESPRDGSTTPDQANGSGTKAKPENQTMPAPAVTKKKGAALPKVTRGSTRGGFVATIALIVWAGLKFLGKVIWKLGTFTVWKIPRHAYRTFRGIKSRKLRRAVALGVVLLIGVGAFFLWPALEPQLAADTRRESCEFLARPAARLYIDGKLMSQEIPPIYRTRLEAGRHAVRFVSPKNRSHEASIVVVKGKPTQWFMNFINDELDERSLISEREEK